MNGNPADSTRTVASHRARGTDESHRASQSPNHKDAVKPESRGVNRRSFLQTSGGVATGLAVTAVPSAAVALGLPAAANARSAPLGQAVRPTGDVPAETVMAYVHDAEKGYVTVVSGTVARTYDDPVLAERLLAAAHAQNR